MGGTSFFNRFSAQRLWKGVTGVSSAGKRKGRGKGSDRKVVIDFNRGQRIGEGHKRMKIPFLNAPANPRMISRPEILGEDKQFKENLLKVHEKMTGFRKRRIHPMDRGWSGNRAPGTKIGPPDEVGGVPFIGFETIVLQARPLLRMTGSTGRTKTIGALVVTGNRNGLAGFAAGKGHDMRRAIANARNRAGQSLLRFNLFDKQTVMHDFFSRYYDTTVFVERKPEGYGIHAHRVIRAICDVVGIKDLYAKVEGGHTAKRNVFNITKAFFLGLVNQRTYQEMADEKGLHLVELREETFDFPRVLASPISTKALGSEPNIKDENSLDFTYYIYNGKIRQVKAPRRNPFLGTPSWQKHLDYQDYVKNREASKLEFAARYEDRSVFEVFPHFKSTAFKNEGSTNKSDDDSGEASSKESEQTAESR